MNRAGTAMKVRVLLLVASVGRAGPRRVSDLDLARLAYFVDAFSPLWHLRPLDRFRLKTDEPRTLLVRRALDQLVLSGAVLPTDVAVESQPVPHVTARYGVRPEVAGPIIAAVQLTDVGRRESRLVEEVVYASAPLLDGRLDSALRLDAGYGDMRIGHNDVIDLASDVGTSATAGLFTPGVTARALAEAELTHLYMKHLERSISREH